MSYIKSLERHHTPDPYEIVNPTADLYSASFVALDGISGSFTLDLWNDLTREGEYKWIYFSNFAPKPTQSR